jgi:phenylacetate-coenzyme A ligase PaaK-like adenylate-forming protein
MSGGLVQQLYFRLPGRARSLAATLQGLYLRWWRYGPGSERLAQAALEREHWSAAQWDAWRQERLAFVLHRAATRVPYYRELWAARRRRGDRASWEVLEHWPILEKEAVRENPRAFVADDRNVRRLFHLRTSGSTGTPLDIWRSTGAVKELYSVGVARTRGWHGLTLRDRRAMVGGQLVAPISQRRPPFWVWNAAMRQLYMSSYHLAPDLIPAYLDALARYRIVYLVGYSSSLYALAQEALRLGRRDLRMVAAITNAEPLFDYQRETIGAAFQCPVRETYGMVELVTMASECERGALHLWPEFGVVEALEGVEPVQLGMTGDLVCTGLVNVDMPLIRYRLGDRGALSDPGVRCPCGRSLPVLQEIEGRMDDVLYTRDGRRIGRLSQVVKGLPFREAQIIQQTLDRIRVRYVPAPTYTAEAERTLIERVRERMGDVAVTAERVSAIPRGANGKFRAVLCELPAAEQQALRQSATATLRPTGAAS